LSGSGAAIIAFTTTRQREIADAMAAAAEAHGAPGRAEILRLSTAGARVIEAE
jgi:homoserine kinase